MLSSITPLILRQDVGRYGPWQWSKLEVVNSAQPWRWWCCDCCL